MDTKMFMVLFMAFLMVGSTIGFVFLSGYADLNSSLKYGKYNFERTAQGLSTKVDGKQYWFRYFPSEVADINVSDDVASRLRNTRVLYLTSDIESVNKEYIASAQYDFNYFLQQNLQIYTVSGFTNENITVNAPRVVCANATPFVPVIDFVDANSTSIALEGNCIVLKAAEGEEFLRGKDRLMYALLGIMNG